jgi:hypothetical protein
MIATVYKYSQLFTVCQTVLAWFIWYSVIVDSLLGWELPCHRLSSAFHHHKLPSLLAHRFSLYRLGELNSTSIVVGVSVIAYTRFAMTLPCNVVFVWFQDWNLWILGIISQYVGLAFTETLVITWIVKGRCKFLNWSSYKVWLLTLCTHAHEHAHTENVREP